MDSNDTEEFIKRLCPHRGIGAENTLVAIQSGIKVKPFFVEFDVQWHDEALYLGHPPEARKEATLAQALNLFVDTDTFPKIDIKLTSQTSQQALHALIHELQAWSPRKALVNMSGTLTADQYMQAESLLINATGRYALLNIDLERYANKSRNEVTRHIEHLGRKPFSVSPNLDSDVADVINFAINESIAHVHFWALPDNKYSLTSLHEVMRSCLDNGLEVYFDIKTENIISKS